MKKSGKNKFYTFMVIPHDSSGKPVTLKLPTFLAHSVALIGVVFLVVFSVSILYSTFLSGKLVHYGLVVSKESENNKIIDQFSGNTNKIQEELQAVLDQNNQLRKILGLKVYKTKIELTGKEQVEKQPYGLNLKLNKISSVLEYSLKEAEDTKASVEQLKARVSEIQSRFASTPSTWPLYGSIVSSYGYRRSPWRGMHTGVDIKANYGDPVRATAPGVVCYSGWRQGYGRTVEINHGYGFKTLYGHNSKLLAYVGEKVSKGQVVSYVGMTGYTTGPHLHYEVRKYDSPINPVAFLNLNILSAGRYF